MKKISVIIVYLIVEFSFGQQIKIDSLLKITDNKIVNIDSDTSYDEIINFKLENFPLENASLIAYKKNRNFVKIILTASSENAKQVNGYYFEADSLFFSEMLESSASNLDDNTPVFETKSYFVKGKLVYQIDTADTINSNSEEYLLAAGESIVDEAHALRMLIAANDLEQN